MQLSIAPKVSTQLKPQVIQQLHILQLSFNHLQDYIQQQMYENPLIELPDYDRTSMSFTHDFAPPKQIFTRQQLIEQIPTKCRARLRKIVHYCIQLLDERLFIAETDEEIAALLRIHPDEVQEAIALLQTFEPIGVGARSYSHFLQLQVQLDSHASSLLKEVVENHLLDLADKQFTKLAEIYDCKKKQIEQLYISLQAYRMHPGETFHDTVLPAIPEAKIYIAQNRLWLEMNDRLFPDIKLQHVYKELLKNEDAHYYETCMQQFTTLVAGIDFRKQTMHRILSYIMDVQYAYLMKQCPFLKPLGLKEIAQQLQVHESTISRAIKDKFLETPFGIQPIAALLQKSACNVTVQQIEQMLRTIIEQENNEQPYSDQQLVEQLAKAQIFLSRRTVTKYREQLCIENSKKRKR